MDPSDKTLPNLKAIPALYEALRYEFFEQEGGFCEDTLGVCDWLAKRAGEVLGLVIQHTAESPDVSSRSANDWRKVRTDILIMASQLIFEADRFFIQHATNPKQTKVSAYQEGQLR